MPAQDRVGRHDARELIQHAATKRDTAHREADPVGVGEAEPSKLALRIRFSS
jgi:hypothetical protein